MTNLKYSANVNDWAKSIKQYIPQLSTRLDEDRKIGHQNLDRFNLPHEPIIEIPLIEFLEDPERVFQILESEEFSTKLIPDSTSGNLKRIGFACLNRDGVFALISQHTDETSQKLFKISVSPFWGNIFGGSIVVDQENNVYFEFVKGLQTGVAKGSADIEFKVVRDRFFRSFKFNFTDEKTRRIAIDTIFLIPHTGHGRDTIFMPGYYEVAIVNKRGRPSVIFLDYRPQYAEILKLDHCSTEIIF